VNTKIKLPIDKFKGTSKNSKPHHSSHQTPSKIDF
jgi:hypothetical protein